MEVMAFYNLGLMVFAIFMTLFPLYLLVRLFYWLQDIYNRGWYERWQKSELRRAREHWSSR